MTTGHEPLDIADFQTLVRYDDAVVRDHRVKGVRTLPATACLDAVYRAAAARGVEPAHLELRDVQFKGPVSLPGQGDRRLLFRSERAGAGLRMRVTTRPAEGAARAEEARVECVLTRVEPDAPAAADVGDLQRLLASGDARPLDACFADLARAGVEYRGFMRAGGSLARAEDRTVAELILGAEAIRHRDGFLIHPTQLEAAVVAACAEAGLEDGAVFLLASIGRVRVWRRPGDRVYADVRPVHRLGDELWTDLRLYDAGGEPVAEFERLTVRRAGTDSRVRPRRPEIAVVGMSGRFPGAADLDEYWRNLEAGLDSVAPAPEDRPTRGRTAGFLDDVDKFDPLFFQIPPSTAALMDPQERLFLEAAYGALENAGHRPADFAPGAGRIGVFVGATWTDYRSLAAEGVRAGAARTVTSALSSLANRVSYVMGLTGPSMAVDTACSSSLTALHLACRSIMAGECDGALVGGVNLLLHPDRFTLMDQLNMISATGRCQAFGAGADGYVPGEGVGVVFVRPLERALADRDTVHGVIVGSAVNHGGRAAGFTVPNPAAQSDVVRRALEEAEVGPGDIGYLEAHGTGTPLGDPVEVVGLHGVFPRDGRPCALGSVKSNVGHLEAAAGVAGLIRVLLQLRHGRITPSLHSRETNREIDFAASPFFVPQEVTDWPRDPDRPRRAGVSSFGAGGSNAHVVIEEYEEPPMETSSPGPEVLVLSALTAERLQAYARRIVRYLRDDAGERSFADVARTLQVGRPELDERLALVAADASEAADLLDLFLHGGEGPVFTGTAGRAPAPDRYSADDLAGAARAWVDGAPTDWAAINGGPRRRLPLPGHPLARDAFWLESAGREASSVATTGPAPVVATPPAAPAVESAAPAEAAVRRTTIDVARQLFEQDLPVCDDELERSHALLSRYAAGAVLQAFRALGLPDEGGTVASLRDRMGIATKFAPFFDACLAVLAKHGLIERRGDLVRLGHGGEDPAVLRAELSSRFSEAAPFLRLLDVCLDAYPLTLRGRKPATEVLFPGADLDFMAGVYRGNRVYDFYSDLAARFVGAAARACEGSRPVRVLEAGAGTGGTSHAALEVLGRSGVEAEYHYTDVGGSFVAHGRRTFGPRYPFARFRLLDMEKDPADQDIDLQSFDVVLAMGAVHAVSDIDRTLGHLHRLLRPSGILVLGEAVENHDMMAVTIGLLDGWHLYRDPERRLSHAPLLSVEGWRAALERTGFGEFTAYGPGLTADAEPTHRVIVASATGVSSPARPDGVPAEEAARPARVDTSGVGRPSGATDAAAVTAEVEAGVTRIVADALGMTAAEIRPGRSLAEYGVDSILAVNIIERINTGFGVDLAPTDIFDHPSVRALADQTVARGGRGPGSPQGRDTGPEPDAGPAPETGPAAGTASRTSAVPAAEHTRAESSDIAVIGMSCRYPDADDYRRFWANIVAGRDSVTEVPPERWRLGEVFQPWPPTPGKTYSRWGGYLRDVDRFDPLFFDIVPAEADFIDPQQRLFLEESWLAIEDAGIDARSLRRVRCGVFAGAPPSDYLTLIRERGLDGSQYVFTGNSAAILPARTAYHLDLTGPCVAVDTACSSSLVAIHQACRSLVAGECEVALAGGVAVFATLDHLRLTSSIGMLSPTGRCRSFDKDADGIAMSEGVGVVVLKPLAKALADGDPIHGVIKGSAVNQDGRTNGITAPSAASQTELETEVYERFGIDPWTIGYVEAHGTGTRLGDPIEVNALTAAFQRYPGGPAAIPIGSVKSNIGHTSHAAGVAGLIKVLTAMRARRIPPSLHFHAANPMIDFSATPFHVTGSPQYWDQSPRRAAISAFGFSGTNGHLVVEEYQDTRPPTSTRTRRALVPLSARTEDSLRQGAGRLADFLTGRTGVRLHDVAATLQLGRVHFEHRVMLVADSMAELLDALAALAEGRIPPGCTTGRADPDARPAEPLRPAPDGDLDRIAAAWVTGRPYDFRDLYEAGAVRRLNLPGYVFADDRCWIPEPDAVETPRASAPPITADEAPRNVRAAVIAAAAAELGVPEDRLDTRVPSFELGFRPDGRLRILNVLNAELGAELPLGAFAEAVSLDELVALSEAAPHVARPKAAPLAEAAPAPETGTVQLAEDYVKRLLAKEARIPVDRIRTRAPLQDIGINSVLIAKLNQRLETELGETSSTLFFEHQTVQDLAGYLAGAHRERMTELCAQEAPPGEPDGAVRENPVRDDVVPAVREDTGHRAESRRPVTDIAVIGMAGRYPMAGDNDAFWQNLVSGRDCVTEVPAERWDHSRYLGDDPDEPGRTYARWGGFMPDVDKFDARFFNVPPKDAETMDPQQRLFLETTWAALEDGGYTPRRLRDGARRRGARKDAGVFVGVTYGEYQLFVDVPIAGYWAVANRVSYHLGFNGPSFAVDTACSASLTAVHLACESLRRGECSYAIAGGVNVTIHPGKYLLLGSGRWASSDGRCRTFGAGGDGYVPGEGVVSLLLKPLEDAVEDGDRIHGVIRSSAINQDGRTNGLTVPNPVAQAELVSEALTEAGVDARSIGYVEAHGTGTSLGDPIEVTALTKAFRRNTDDRGYCAIGSAKSSIGHLEAAAGAAGLVKTLLQLRHETIAPSLHADPPNPNIDFDSSPFQVARRVMPWRRLPGGPPRLAAVSSFGAGGSNAHVVVEESPADTRPSATGGPWPILLSARRRDRLEEHARNLLRFVTSEEGACTSLGDIAWTLMVGREPFEHRLAFVARTHEDLSGALGDFLHGRTREGLHTGAVPAHRDETPGEAAADRGHLREVYGDGRWARLAELWAAGWSIDWEDLAADRRGRIVGLPAYPFARERYWIAPEDYGRRPAGDDRGSGAPVAEPVEAAPPASEPAPEDPGRGGSADGAAREKLEATIKDIFAELTKLPAHEIDVHADFLDFGFDSVVTVRMLSRLMKAYGVHIPGVFIEEYTTIRSLADHVIEAGIIAGAGRTNTDQAGPSADEVILAAPARTPERLVLDAPLPVESVFITGVTGVLGGKLLCDLLTDTSVRINCLVRGRDQAAARDRIRYFLGVYDREGRLAGEFERRVTVLLGDVSRDRLGLDEETLRRLADETDLTIHAAARTTLVTFYDTLAPVNVHGTRRIIDFALRTKHKYLVYVSSFSALGDWLIENRPPFSEEDIELGQGYENLPYQQTKYHAEKLIRAASDQGLVWNIVRPGNIMGDSRSGRYPLAEVTVKGVYYDIFKTTAETGVSMLTPNYWDVSPVDYVSAGLLHLVLRRPSYRETYHLTNPNICRLFDMFHLVDAYGYEVRPVSIEQYHRMAIEGLFRSEGSDEPYQSQMIEMVKYGIETWGREHYEQSAYPDSSYTRRLLAEAGISCPPVTDIVPVYLDYCVREGYMAPPPRRPVVLAGGRGPAAYGPDGGSR